MPPGYATLLLSAYTSPTSAAVAEALRAIAGTRPMLDLEKDWRDLGVPTAAGYYLDEVLASQVCQRPDPVLTCTSTAVPDVRLLAHRTV